MRTYLNASIEPDAPVRCETTATELLREALRALNSIPRRSLSGGQFKDTYALACAIERHIAATK